MASSDPVVANQTGMGTNYLVQTLAGALYVFYIDGLSDVAFKKSTDGGRTWGVQTVIHAGTVIALAVWYDRWSGIAAGLIHCAYTDNGVDDILYRNIDTENSDALSGATTVFLGSTAIAGGALSITRARGGNLVVAGSIDAGTEDGAWESTDVGATWGSTIADPSEAETTDQYLLLPGWNADTQDVMLIFWDVSANELSVKRYDNSANSWEETSIATAMVDLSSTTGFPNVAAAVDLINSQNVVIAWTNTDTANADLRCWKITDTTITEMTNIVQNSTDDQGLCALGIETQMGAWHAAYCGKSDGTETWASSVKLYMKISVDGGTTWQSESSLSPVSFYAGSLWGPCRNYGSPIFLVLDENEFGLRIAMEAITPHASYQVGVM